MNQTGIVGIFVLILILAIAVAGGAYYLGRVSTKPQPTKTQQQAQITSSPDPTANWKTYSNDNLGFSVKLPPTWTVRSGVGNDPSIYIDSDIKASWGDNVAPEGGFSFYIYIGQIGNSEKLSFTQLATKDISNDLKEIFTYEKGNIGPYTFYKTDSLPSAYGALNVYTTRDETKYILIRLSPYDKSEPPNNQEKVLPVFNLILSTFKFADQTATPTTSPEGKFCGGIAGNLPENQCPTGYRCQLDYTRTERTDSGGKCVKE